MGVIQNTKNLTIKQIKQLIMDNGLAANGNEYCLESLHSALAEKQQKAAEKAVKRAQLGDYYDLVFPPPVSKKFNSGLNTHFYSDEVNTNKEVNKVNKIMFKFHAPLWKVENLSLDERILIFGKVR